MDFYIDEQKEEQIALYFEQASEEELDGKEKYLHRVELDDSDKEEIKQRIELYLEKEKIIDNILEKAIDGWDFARLARVEKAILRLAYFEMKYVDGIDQSIAINEAVSLSKKFGNDESYAFVNAILSKLV